MPAIPWSESIDRQRHIVAAGMTAALALVMGHALRPPSFQSKLVEQPPMELRMVELPKGEPPPTPPVAAEPPPPKPAPAVQRPAPPQEAPRPVAAVPAPAASAPTEAARTSPSAPAAVAPPAAAPTVAAPPTPQVPQTARIQDEFIGRLRALINENKRYPTGRDASLQRPRGVVRVMFVLTRDGTLDDADVLESSNSLILDNAAVSLVRRTSYPAFPADAWAGEARHRFTVDLNYEPTG